MVGICRENYWAEAIVHRMSVQVGLCQVFGVYWEWTESEGDHPFTRTAHEMPQTFHTSDRNWFTLWTQKQAVHSDVFSLIRQTSLKPEASELIHAELPIQLFKTSYPLQRIFTADHRVIVS
jgi:hypothetical protein